MLERKIVALQDFIQNYGCIIPALSDYVEAIDQALVKDDIQSLVDIYDALYPIAEKELWTGGSFDETLNFYHAMFREQEGLIRSMGRDDRYHFILSIPVADCPHHVRKCLHSIYQLCVVYAYGGRTDGQFNRVQVIIAEDSKYDESIVQHKSLADEFTEKGLRVHYFGLQEQYELLQKIPHQQRQELNSILTSQSAGQFYLKGQAANRNLSYLKCLQLTEDKSKTLYYMVDSDQTFRVNRQSTEGDQSVIALNYFYYINQVFTSTDTSMLTGNLVGDPPVSPSVMAANFLDDVIAYVNQLTKANTAEGCAFHVEPDNATHDVAYHDKTHLFGFDQKGKTYPYRCSMKHEHNNLDCFQRFSEKINNFFYGEYLTRKTCFQYSSAFTELTAARTIYPGNYIVNYEGLKNIIPFGDLKLSMSGPTAGRLVQAEINQRFASINLPMLRTRHLQESNADEFRSEVEQDKQAIDLANEFERQFFGDLMLFTVVEVTADESFDGQFTQKIVKNAMDRVEKELLVMYQEKHDQILDKNSKLKLLIHDNKNWWNTMPQANEISSNFDRFIQNIELNFNDDAVAYQQIMDENHRDVRKIEMTQALLKYRQSRNAWDMQFT